MTDTNDIDTPLPDPVQDATDAAAAIKAKAQRVWEELRGFSSSYVLQLQHAAGAAYKELLVRLKDAKLTPQQAEDAQWATNKLLAVGVLSVGADPETLKRLEQDRKDALSVLADIAAIKALNGEQLVKAMFGRALWIAHQFVLDGATAVVGLLFTAV
ncbi:hypothetical protein [Fontivita pretiosa]|uniref:hypothetical protein n=1 Tax=Fontivita pretiosa TaxID=2989684 RepID=UPI003D171BC7